ncbi:MAG: ribonuclease III [bacterium]|nr:ribonuclease III [bacterium]
MKIKLNKNRKKELKVFQKSLRIKFRNIFLLNKGLTHTSYAHEVYHNEEHNEKLEFLGDAVLSLILAEYLYLNYAHLQEGTLSKFRSYVASENILYLIAKKINLQNFILLSRGEELTGGRNKKSLVSDAIESLIGAYYIDSGLKKTRKLVMGFLKDFLQDVDRLNEIFDFKSQLQEHTQKYYRKNPVYAVIREEGPEHRKTFETVVKLENRILGRGIGENKKTAEKEAARNALLKINKGEMV